jgi:hypothetical protein
MEIDSSPATEERRSLGWFHPMPVRLLIILIVLEGILLLSQWFCWLPFNQHKGWTVLVAIAAVGVTMFLMFLWWLLALCLHWRFQFSLRSLLALAIVVAIPFSWLAVETKRARKQRVAVKEIENRGGSVRYDDLMTGMEHPPLPVPLWLQRLLGSDFFEDAMQVSFWNTPATDADLEALEELPGLECLYLVYRDNTRVTDAGMEHLKGLTQLRDLSLCNTRVTDAGLTCLRGLTKLESLVLATPHVTDVGLAFVAELPRLQELELGNTHVTDAGLEHLKGLAQLTSLYLSGTRVTDKGVENLQQALPDCHIAH